MQALYMVVWPDLGKLSLADITSRYELSESEIPKSMRIVITGWQYGVKKDWLALAKLDNILSKTKETDLWYPDAVKLRLDWRLRVTMGDRTNDMLEEGKSLAEKTLLLYKTTDLLTLHTAYCIRLKDANCFVESAWVIADYINQHLSINENAYKDKSSSNYRTLITRINGFNRLLESDFISPVKSRAQRVRDEFIKLNNKLK